MRTLEKNKTLYYEVHPSGYVDETDGNGFYTGEKTMTFSTPVAIRLSTYPASGKIVEQMFGKDASLDMIAVSTEVVLTKDSLLFEVTPTTNYYTTYSYRVDVLNRSLNGYSYGLKRRT